MKKTLTMVLAFALVFALGVGGTLAWLTASTGEVVNTFTVGDINIELNETDAVDGAKAYDFIPGDTLSKDPTVTVLEGSEKCHVFVTLEVENNVVDGVTILSWTMDDKWVEVEAGVYMYNEVVDASEEDQILNVLKDTTVTVNENVTKDMVEDINDAEPTMTFTAYAIQSENLEAGLTNAEIWALAH